MIVGSTVWRTCIFSGEACDGGNGEMELIFRQTMPFVQAANQWLSYQPDDPEGPNFSRLNTMEQFRLADGTFELEISWPGTWDSVNHWAQSSSPLNSGAVTGYRAINVAHTDNYWGGLERSTADDYTLLDGSVNHANWYYSIGNAINYNGGIPGPNDRPASVAELRVCRPTFRVTNSQGNWASQRAQCQQLGGDIASIHSQSEFEQVLAILDSGTDYYIGAVKSSGVWAWVDGGTWWQHSYNDGLSSGETTIVIWTTDTNRWHDDNTARSDRKGVCRMSGQSQRARFRCPTPPPLFMAMAILRAAEPRGSRSHPDLRFLLVL